MKENKAYKFRIYPDSLQQEMFLKTFGAARFVYNRMLEDKIAYYEETGKMLKATPAQYKNEYEFLKEVDSLALANAQLQLETAYRNFFRDKSIGFPKFKSKKHPKQSYTTNLVNGNIRIEGKKIRLPKVGMVRIRIHREIPEGWVLKNVTVSKEPSGKYYASLLYEIPESESQAEGAQREKRFLGIDYAMDGLAVMSDGTRAEHPKYFRQAEEKLAREQRKLSHCEKGSRNYAKQKRKVAVIHEKVRNQRKDFLHKMSRRLADGYDVIGVEDIDMRAMSQTLHFGKSVSDNGFGMLRTMLAYKLEERGKELVKVDRFYPSSKRCSRCGRIKENLTLSDRIYRCKCGNVMDRDVNAAINIRLETMRLKAS